MQSQLEDIHARKTPRTNKHTSALFLNGDHFIAIFLRQKMQRKQDVVGESNQATFPHEGTWFQVHDAPTGTSLTSYHPPRKHPRGYNKNQMQPANFRQLDGLPTMINTSRCPPPHKYHIKEVGKREESCTLNNNSSWGAAYYNYHKEFLQRQPQDTFLSH